MHENLVHAENNVNMIKYLYNESIALVRAILTLVSIFNYI